MQSRHQSLHRWWKLPANALMETPAETRHRPTDKRSGAACAQPLVHLSKIRPVNRCLRCRDRVGLRFGEAAQVVIARTVQIATKIAKTNLRDFRPMFPSSGNMSLWHELEGKRNKVCDSRHTLVEYEEAIARQRLQIRTGAGPNMAEG